MRKLVPVGLATFDEEWRDDTLRTLYLNAQSGIRSVVYNVEAEVVRNLLSKDVIRETRNAYPENFLNNNTATDRLLDKLLASSTIIGPIAMYVRCKTDSALRT